MTTGIPGGYSLERRPPTLRELRALNDAVGWTDLPGDGGIYYIQDLIVHPDHQGRGIGDFLMGEVWRYLAEHADRDAFIGLMTAEGRAGFYERWGFAKRPPGRPGMALGWNPEDPPPTPGSVSAASE